MQWLLLLSACFGIARFWFWVATLTGRPTRECHNSHSSLCTLSFTSTQLPPLLRMFTITAHQVCGQTASIFVFLDGALRPVVCSCASPVPLRHPSFFYNMYDYALQSFLSLSSADPTFSFRESIPPPISPLYHKTGHDSSPERPRALTFSSNQKRLSHPNVSVVFEAEVGEANLFVTIHPMVSYPFFWRFLSNSLQFFQSRPVLGSDLPIVQPWSTLDSEMEQETPRRQCVSFATSDHQLAFAE